MIAKRGGFSLVEILIVVTIIAILAGAAVPYVQDYIDEARRSRCKSDLDEIRNALVLYEVKRGTTYATTNIASLVGPFLTRAIVDPWGADYVISNASSTVYSRGSDGLPSTGDDLALDYRPRMAVSKIVWYDANQDGAVTAAEDAIHFYMTRPLQTSGTKADTGLTTSWAGPGYSDLTSPGTWIYSNRVASFTFATVFTPGSDTITINGTSATSNDLYDNNNSSVVIRTAKGDVLKIIAQ